MFDRSSWYSSSEFTEWCEDHEIAGGRVRLVLAVTNEKQVSRCST